MRVIARLTPRFLQVEEDNRKIREKSMWWDKISQAHKEKMVSVKALADQTGRQGGAQEQGVLQTWDHKARNSLIFRPETTLAYLGTQTRWSSTVPHLLPRCTADRAVLTPAVRITRDCPQITRDCPPCPSNITRDC